MSRPRVTLFLAWMSLSLFADDNILLPWKVRKCIEDHRVASLIVVDTLTNPYYLRGDFNGDGIQDYAVAVKGQKTRRNGILVCLARRGPFLIGADRVTTPPFSDMPEDNFVAPFWEVATRSEVLGFQKNNRVVPLPKGEVIKMIWEDGIHYIYWDGTRFRWSPLVQ